jgi:hypothetical protein
MQGFWFKFKERLQNDIKNSCLFIFITFKELLSVWFIKKKRWSGISDKV